jgi:hypothetical protein
MGISAAGGNATTRYHMLDLACLSSSDFQHDLIMLQSYLSA